MSRFTYKVVATLFDRFAVIRQLPSGDVAGFDAIAARNNEQRHFAIYRASGIQNAAADSRTYPTRREAEAVVAGLDQLSAAEAFDLREIGRAEHGGQTWVVFDDGHYRYVVEAGYFDACGVNEREHDGERRAGDYNDWCRRGLWAKDDVAAEVAGLCDLTHVHSAESGTSGRVDAVENG